MLLIAADAAPRRAWNGVRAQQSQAPPPRNLCRRGSGCGTKSTEKRKSSWCEGDFLFRILPLEALARYTTWEGIGTVALMNHEPMVQSFGAFEGTIILIGGTFDPVHHGHLAMAETVWAHTAGATAVVFIPARQNPLKRNPPLASDQQRLEMVRLALRERPDFYVSPIETSRVGESFTVDTLKQIRSEAPAQTSLVFVIGADQLSSLHRWRNIEELFALARIAVVGRNAITVDGIAALSPQLPAAIRDSLAQHFIPFSNPISSTAIREHVRSGLLDAVREQLPNPVFDFILSTGLYRS
ncbi:MAG: nicotinate (nicotinamide) nucleotide adenylyltransferase [Proteobacteria bacterium]|nr:nicotinate (nicotinamide) nucleotide adenylyltransferase [Pseudomonadota bacterium]